MREALYGRLAPDGRRAVMASWDSMLRVCDLECGQTLYTLDGCFLRSYCKLIIDIAITPDGCQVAMSPSHRDDTLRLWNLETGQTEIGRVTGLALTSDGRHAVSSSSYDETVILWDLEAGKKIASFTGDRPMTACIFTPDERTIIAGDESGRVHFLQLVEADETRA